MISWSEWNCLKNDFLDFGTVSSERKSSSFRYTEIYTEVHLDIKSYIISYMIKYIFDGLGIKEIYLSL